MNRVVIDGAVGRGPEPIEGGAFFTIWPDGSEHTIRCEARDILGAALRGGARLAPGDRIRVEGSLVQRVEYVEAYGCTIAYFHIEARCITRKLKKG